MEAERVYKCGDKTVKVYRDEMPPNPRENSNLGTMVQFEGRWRYIIGDEQNWSREDLKEKIKSGEIAQYLLFGAYDYDGSIQLSESDEVDDRRFVGAIFVTRATVLKEYSMKRLSKRVLGLALDVMKAEVEEYARFATGDAWGYEVVETGDSCWGFLGDDKKSGLLESALGDEAKNAVLE